LDLWSDVIEALNSIGGVTSERELRKKLKKHFRESWRGNVGILDHMGKGDCVERLLVPCTLFNFYERVFDALDIAKNCNMRLLPILTGVMFLPVSWSQSCEERLVNHVVSILGKYHVSQICVKFPLSAFPRGWRGF